MIARRFGLLSLLLLTTFASGCPASPGAGAGGDEVLATLKEDRAVRDREYKALAARLAALEEKVSDVLTAMEFLAVDVDGIKRNTWEMLQGRTGPGESPEPEAPESYRRMFAPETRAALEKAAADKGLRLLADRVEAPAVIVQDRTMLEFVAVAAGGKEHESIVAVTGSTPHGEGRADGLPGLLNACILALGYEKGTPVRATKDGKVLPPEGKPIFVYLEWEAGGEKIRARAEDLVYNLQTKRTMDRGKWVYVGSRFERDFSSSQVLYMADLSGDIVATYSWPNTIVDNTTSEGGDDVYYACFTPRIPAVGTKVTLVLSREELPAKEFPPPPEDEDGDGPPK